MKTQKITLILTLSLFGIFSCKKKDEKKDSKATVTNIYISGTSTSDSDETVYWKNGEMIKCTTTDASAMIINNGDIYFPTQKGYSKNGIQFDLPHASGIKNISVSGNDVYALGLSDIPQATVVYYWKNNDIINLPDTPWVYASSRIATTENNVFVGCYSSIGSFKMSYWENNSWHLLTSKCYTIGMTAFKSDLYIYGTTYIGLKPVYLKNGVENIIEITNGDSLQFINDMVIQNDDVYFTIYASTSYNGVMYEGIPLYWKNGHKVGVGLLDTYTIPESIAVDGEDVYVVANQAVPSSDGSKIESYNIIMWKNGVQETVIHNAKAQKIIVSH